MIHFFNRSEVYVGYSLDQALEMYSRIKEGGVECQLKVHRPSHNGARNAVYLPKTQSTYQIFVHRKDTELAMYLMNQRR